MLSFRLCLQVVLMRFVCMGCISCNKFCNINYAQLLIYIYIYIYITFWSKQMEHKYKRIKLDHMIANREHA